MKNILFTLGALFMTTVTFSQAGHIMQGVGSVNMSMGGAATAQPVDISGALHWNPATISAFDEDIIKLDVGLFFSSPELSSTVPEFDNEGQPTGNFYSGTTEDDRGISPLPALAAVWSKPDSKHTFGASVFGISGFGVTFPENMSNPINMPQANGGFGRIESDYMLLQIGFAWAYEITDELSLGIQPTFNYSGLELMPNPTANPNQAGYPSTDKASAFGFGGQLGLFYNSKSGFKAGVSYKTEQNFGEFELENTYLDGSTSTNNFTMDYPSIFSVGLGYSLGTIDLALDYRTVDYENTDGFSSVGWTQTGSVAGFGWENITIISAGIQYKGINKLPLRFGYTYSSNPINSDVAFFNIPATAIIKNAFQVGLSYEVSDRFQLDVLYHYGSSGDATSGPVLNPQFIQNSPPYGAIPGSEVSYDMTTSMIGIGASLKL
ncbi:MAG: outer membrane protein transport protein [Bacteroidota bacterium]|uniref:Outer membrane protein transport protein n=1 Tax=Flagellimonas profundi TaxID=2915620 RepID=A0ABS3FH96_9FLAO|nr:outer membrane protein transport protein [Allomuricauda profundi]MBO0342557.1 outer membrane protein transport protein [Allomuricauda profundi]MEC7770843.1 outer membrane protein transport protein [Bacteroidota bacterium]